jgi:hypothetical protein
MGLRAEDTQNILRSCVALSNCNVWQICLSRRISRAMMQIIFAGMSKLMIVGRPWIIETLN